MIFSSPEFLFGFLPIVVIASLLASRLFGKPAAIGALVVGSLIFYGWWNPWFLILLVSSMAFNFAVGRALIATPSRTLLAFGIAVNLGLLGYFKYAGFLVATANTVADTSWSIGNIALPLAISFFTFQQIAFLVDARRGRVDSLDFLHYCLFVAFFPQLIAGPIVHHSEMMPQFRQMARITVRADDLAIGLIILAIGLYKKIIIADTLAGYADSVFATAGAGTSIAAAWSGVLAFTFQIYFDFSGYSDIAIGLARIFGIRLPLNFHSPYKAASIIEFWRCWHMTLSRFLRDYLYIPLGGNRHGRMRRHLNLMITMTLGGLWHGAGWTFVFWGALHGFYLIVNHVWHAVLRRHGRDPARHRPFAGWLGRPVTFLAVVIGWVFFRTESWDKAMSLLGAMVGANSVTAATAPPADPVLFLCFALLLAVVWFTPNTQQWLAPFEPALPSSLAEAGIAERPARTDVAMHRLWWFVPFAAASGLVAIVVMLTRSGAQPAFIYFVF